MPNPSKPGPSAESEKSRGLPMTVLELSRALEELDRVVAELQESLNELALPFDDASRSEARAAIAAASRDA